MIKDGMDAQMMIDFFEHVYQNSSRGFLALQPFPVPQWVNGQREFRQDRPVINKFFLFDIEDGFEQVPKFIREMEGQISTQNYQWQFCKSLFSSRELSLGTVLENPCIFVDCDRDRETVEYRMKRYHIVLRPPSIKLHTSPHGCHFYWQLKKPAALLDHFRLCALQVRLCHALGGDMGRVTFVEWSRVPGLHNFTYPGHFASAEVVNNHLYDWADFDDISLHDLSQMEAISIDRLYWSNPYRLRWYDARRSFLEGREVWYDPAADLHSPPG